MLAHKTRTLVDGSVKVDSAHLDYHGDDHDDDVWSWCKLGKKLLYERGQNSYHCSDPLSKLGKCCYLIPPQSRDSNKPSYIILCVQATASTGATADKVGLTMVQSYNIHNQNVFYEHFCSFRNMQKLNSIISSSLIYLFVRVRNIYVYL